MKNVSACSLKVCRAKASDLYTGILRLALLFKKNMCYGNSSVLFSFLASPKIKKISFTSLRKRCLVEQCNLIFIMWGLGGKHKNCTCHCFLQLQVIVGKELHNY